MATFQNITTTTSAVPPAGGIRAVIKAARTALPTHELQGVPLRRFVAAVCTAEVEHACSDFWTIVHGLNAAPLFDRHREPDCDAEFRFSHEIHAAAALNWLSHLQTNDSDRHGPWARWSTMSLEGRREWLQRRRYLVHGLIRAVNNYRAARGSSDIPSILATARNSKPALLLLKGGDA